MPSRSIAFQTKYRQSLIGNRVGRLLITDIEQPDARGNRYATAICDCGTQKRIAIGNLRSGSTQSCGCLRAVACVTHGYTRGRRSTPEYRTWSHMKERCVNPRENRYEDYGGRGIAVCDRWLHSFQYFLADMGPRPSPKHSIDRIDNDGNYEPGNCRWATKAEQAVNARSNVNITASGKTLCAAEWGRRIGIDKGTLYRRVRTGRTPKDILAPARLRRHDAPILLVNGQSLTVPEWARLLGIKANTIHARLYRGWSAEEALETRGREP